jgi:uracil-DNA glycosylase family 4
MSKVYSNCKGLEDKILKCKECKLKNQQCFLMEGPEFSEIMIVGQGPHPNRKPGQMHFSGKSSLFFDYLLNTLGLKRGEIHVTNVIKCIGGREEGSEDNCRKFLLEEIKGKNPKEVFLLGTKATIATLGSKQAYGPHFLRGRNWYVLPHPATCVYSGDDNSSRIQKYKEVIEQVKKYRTTLSVSGKGQMTLDNFVVIQERKA